MLKWLWVSLVVIVFDQASKFIASGMLILHDPVAVLPFFNLTLMHNTGAAFSFLAGASGWQRWFFTVLAVIVSVVLAVWLRRLQPQEKWMAAALALVLGGAVGNLIDRVMYGYVVDFIQLYYKDWYYPAFNIADSGITVGAVMLVIDALRGKEKQGRLS